MIRSSRITLRPVSEDDIPAIADGCSDPDIARFIPMIPQPYTVDHARELVEAAQRSWVEGGAAELVIEDAATREFLGIISVGLQTDGSAGYWIKASARGSGIASEALALAARWVRDTHDVRRLYLTTHPSNVASQRVAEKAGFERVGVVEHDPPFADGEASAFRFELQMA